LQHKDRRPEQPVPFITPKSQWNKVLLYLFFFFFFSSFLFWCENKQATRQKQIEEDEIESVVWKRLGSDWKRSSDKKERKKERKNEKKKTVSGQEEKRANVILFYSSALSIFFLGIFGRVVPSARFSWDIIAGRGIAFPLS